MLVAISSMERIASVSNMHFHIYVLWATFKCIMRPLSLDPYVYNVFKRFMNHQIAISRSISIEVSFRVTQITTPSTNHHYIQVVVRWKCSIARSTTWKISKLTILMNVPSPMNENFRLITNLESIKHLFRFYIAKSDFVLVLFVISVEVSEQMGKKSNQVVLSRKYHERCFWMISWVCASDRRQNSTANYR